MKPKFSQFNLLTIVVGALGLVAPSVTLAAAGDLDPAFGRGGLARTDFADTDEYGYAVKVQPDGKIVVAGQSGIYPLFHAALARFHPNGRLDSTFGIGGKTTAALDAGGDGISAIAFQSDGKIVTAGLALHDNSALAFIVGRFNSDGSLDRSFGNNGSVKTTFGDASAQGDDVIVQSDGKIIVVGTTGAGSYSDLNDFALARYNSDGSLDQSFGQGGKVTTHFPGIDNTGSRATSAILQRDGKLLVAGTYVNQGVPNAFALARYSPNGSLDRTFGNSGLVTTRIGLGDALAFGLILQEDARIVLAGYSATTQDNDFTLACYNPNGSLDTTFGNAGVTTTNFSASSDDIAYSIALQRDGKLVVGGKTGDYPEQDLALARYTSNGILDPAFGAGGIIATDFGSIELGFGVAIQHDGKILLSGGVFGRKDNFDMAVACYLGR